MLVVILTWCYNIGPHIASTVWNICFNILRVINGLPTRIYRSDIMITNGQQGLAKYDEIYTKV